MSTDIKDFVSRHAAMIGTSTLQTFHHQLPLLLAELAVLQSQDQPHLRTQAEFLARFVEDCLDGAYRPTDSAALTEAVFALQYLHKGVDIIPDALPHVGFADDSAVVRTVLVTNSPEFVRYEEATGAAFSKLALTA